MRARGFWGLFFVSQKSVVTQKHFLPIFQFKTNACVTSSFFSRASREARVPALSPHFVLFFARYSCKWVYVFLCVCVVVRLRNCSLVRLFFCVFV